MYLLYVKGRGYFDGFRKVCDNSRYIRSAERGNGISKTLIKNDYVYKIKFKRDPDTVKNVNFFDTKIIALEKILEIDRLGTETKYKFDSTTSVWNDYEDTFNYDALLKVGGKLEVVEKDVQLKKRTVRLDSRKTIHIRKSFKNGDSTCDFCKTTFISAEPMASIGNQFYICNNCLTDAHIKLEAEYRNHPKVDQLDQAWNLEMIAREI